MIVDKLLTRRGWRVVAHCMLAVAGMGLLYFLSLRLIENIHRGHALNLGILAVAIAVSVWLVVLGSVLAKAELTGWK